ncbi:hypothetical protein PCASD_16166 [Puccinia coronata f. sp. avenae]|uniref:Uncharacterized protein n=1 Tax=Puccinia coronata f. sp. avenae TaxID=200324 RepID=A0A2N5UBE3_9BASI|nr:hypothetical protein PCASD_16166 [Puccinia coronata f. sp. avenae]
MLEPRHNLLRPQALLVFPVMKVFWTARPNGVRTPICTPKKTACSRCTPLRKGVQRLHALPRRLHAICMPSIGVRPCQTGVQSLHACLEGVQSLHTLWTGVQALHACWLM